MFEQEHCKITPIGLYQSRVKYEVEEKPSVRHFFESEKSYKLVSQRTQNLLRSERTIRRKREKDLRKFSL